MKITLLCTFLTYTHWKHEVWTLIFMTFIHHIVYLNHIPIILYNYNSINYLEGKKQSSAWIGVGSRAHIADLH